MNEWAKKAVSNLGGMGPWSRLGLSGLLAYSVVLLLSRSQEQGFEVQQLHVNTITQMIHDDFLARDDRAKEDRAAMKASVKSLWEAQKEATAHTRDAQKETNTVLREIAVETRRLMDEVRGTRKEVGVVKKAVEGMEP